MCVYLTCWHYLHKVKIRECVKAARLARFLPCVRWGAKLRVCIRGLLICGFTAVNGDLRIKTLGDFSLIQAPQRSEVRVRILWQGLRADFLAETDCSCWESLSQGLLGLGCERVTFKHLTCEGSFKKTTGSTKYFHIVGTHESGVWVSCETTQMACGHWGVTPAKNWRTVGHYLSLLWRGSSWGPRGGLREEGRRASWTSCETDSSPHWSQTLWWVLEKQ